MGEAAVKEPSMEDILSSIRKIISEENSTVSANSASAPEDTVVEEQSPMEASAPEASPEAAVEQGSMSDVLKQVRSSVEMETTPEPAPEVSEPAPIAEAVTPAPSEDDLSGINAAKMLSSIASAETAAEESADQVSSEVEKTVSTPSFEAEPMSEQPAQSLADIASSVAEKIESEPKVIVQTPEADIHVEMADAEPAQAPSELVSQEISEPVAETAPASLAAVETMVKEEMEFKGALMSPSANGEVSNAFDRLKRSAMDDIDAKTEAILRPMLREWLDENLPNMVERLVREEIERVARGV